MKLIKAVTFQSLIKHSISGKHSCFFLLTTIIFLVFIETAVCKIEYNPEDFGSSKSEPINSGFFFYKGKYIDAPYIVERRGLDVYINDIIVSHGPIHKLYDYSVDTDPGYPPPGVSPFEPASESGDTRDNYYSKKWRYLCSHYDYETAKKMIFDVYKECTEIENVHWTNSNVISVFDKKIGFEIGINLEPKNQVRSLTKNDLIERMENTKNHYEKRLQNDLLFIEKKGLSLISPRSKVLDTLKVLVSDISDSEKFKIFNEKNIFPGCKEEFPWIVTDFEASSQLKERIINLEQKNLSKNIAREAGYILDNPIFAPDIDSTTLEEEKTTKSHNDVPGSIEKSDNSPNDVISLIDNTKTISQIENPSNNSKRIIVLSFLSIGMISLLFLYIYRHRLTK